MPKTHTRVMITPEIIAITAPVTSVMSLIVSPASANNPTIISFHINAMINPKAAAIAVDMFIFTSLNLTILSLASLKLLIHDFIFTFKTIDFFIHTFNVTQLNSVSF